MTATSFEPFGDHGHPVGRQRWRDMLFLHQPISVQRLRSLVPAPLDIDTFNDEGWITLIPFAIFDSRPIGAPPRLALDFLEINLRTYVRSPTGEPGIYFFSLEASSWLAVAGARLAYALPYFPATMSARKHPDGTIHYQSSRRVGGRAALDMRWQPGAVAESVATAGSLDHFLIERYVLFALRGHRLYRTRVRHAPYPLCSVSLDGGRETLLAAAELPPLSLPPLHAHGSPGVDVDIFSPQRVPDRRHR
jgi:uncharacterized protein YqjF (DUF2071 family)